MQYHMNVVVHNSVGTQVDGKSLRKLMEPVLNPFSSMLIVYTSADIATTKVRLPHAARNAVVIRCNISIYLLVTR